MATNYPANLDSLSNPAAGDSMADVSHADQHANANDAIEAIEAELGTDPSGSAATVKARIAAVESTANGAAQKSANLSDLASASTARTNLGLGTAATTDASAYATAAQGTDARTPTAHKASHATGGSDALAPSDIGAATAAQGALAATAVQPARTVSAGTGLSGGGDLSADRTLSVASKGITASLIADDTITAGQVAANAIGSSELADSAVDTAALQDGSVTLAKLADNSSLVVSATQPTSPKIGTIWVQSDATVDVAPPYTTAQIADSAITSAKIADGTIVNADVSASAAIAASKISGTAVVLTDLPYTWSMTGVEVPTAKNCTVTQAYFAATIYNARTFNSSSAQNDYMEWTATLAAGTYTLRTIFRTADSYGIATIAIDGSNLGTTIDMYAAAPVNNSITDITGISIATGGRHTIRYTAATKNASSSSYLLSLQGFSLTRTGA